MVVFLKKKNMNPRAIGLGVLVLCLWGDEQGTSVLLQQSLGFQPISQRPLRQHHRQSQHGYTFPESRLASFAQVGEDFENANNEKNSANKRRVGPCHSHLTALCVVPPDEAWDTLQRARHFAGDQSYYEWPPAIRLFHPFCESSKVADVALECARIVEEQSIKPFKITLNRWTVMPYPETLVSATNHKNNFGDKQEESVVKPEDDDSYHPVDPQDKEVQALIKEEVRKGKIRKRLRDLKQRRKQETKEFMKRKAFLELANNTQQLLAIEMEILKNTHLDEQEGDDPEEEEAKKTAVPEPRDIFDGRAMIALEPDERSVRKLQQLRRLFQKELLSESDPSWGFARPSEKKEAHEKMLGGVWYDDNPSASGSFRPMIPIGAFTTFEAAISTAKKLKGLWGRSRSRDSTVPTFVTSDMLLTNLLARFSILQIR